MRVSGVAGSGSYLLPGREEELWECREGGVCCWLRQIKERKVLRRTEPPLGCRAASGGSVTELTIDMDISDSGMETWRRA